MNKYKITPEMERSIQAQRQNHEAVKDIARSHGIPPRIAQAIVDGKYVFWHEAGLVERGGISHGKPSYRWLAAYSRNGTQYPWFTFREAQNDARHAGQKAIFIPKKNPA
jgi:hypothetical protein